MKNGLYRAQFQTSLATGNGVVFVQDGKILGGDSSLYYIGVVSVSGDDLNVQVECRPYIEVQGAQCPYLMWIMCTSI
jgi:hypothetical protein